MRCCRRARRLRHRGSRRNRHRHRAWPAKRPATGRPNGQSPSPPPSPPAESWCGWPDTTTAPSPRFVPRRAARTANTAPQTATAPQRTAASAASSTMRVGSMHMPVPGRRVSLAQSPSVHPESSRMSIESVAAGWRLPGIANLHSHAFQRAMAGLAERQTHPSDSFWTWRETMYRMAARFDPELLHAVASQLYVEMLEAGYTTVCEFHYLHHAPDGSAYAAPTAMSDALIAAARDTGIRLTLLPVLYVTGGFDGRALGERQKHFGHDVGSYLRLFEALHARQDATLRVGCAL